MGMRSCTRSMLSCLHTTMPCAGSCICGAACSASSVDQGLLLLLLLMMLRLLPSHVTPQSRASLTVACTLQERTPPLLMQCMKLAQ
jgi:hypothetical protein